MTTKTKNPAMPEQRAGLNMRRQNERELKGLEKRHARIVREHGRLNAARDREIRRIEKAAVLAQRAQRAATAKLERGLEMEAKAIVRRMRILEGRLS